MARKIGKILLAVIVLFILMGTFRFALSKAGVMPLWVNKTPPKFLERFTVQQSDYFADTVKLPTCDNKQELLAQSPLTLSDFTYITPLGLLAPTAHVFPSSHLYFNVRRIDPKNAESLPVEVPVVAPTDLIITKVKYIQAANRPEFNDGFVEFGVCKDFKGYFDHLKTFAPKIQEAFERSNIKHCDKYTLSYKQPIGDVDYTLCQKRVSVSLKSGETIGTAGGGEGQKALDFGAFDRRVSPKTLANPARWETRKQFVHVVCVLDYYSEPLKSMLKSRLGSAGQNGEFISAPCGEVVQDLPGTAMGTWVAPGTDIIEHDPPHLALVHGYTEPQYLIFSMGDSANHAGLPRGMYTYLPKYEGLVNRHFKDIRADNTVYCFETENRYQHDAMEPVNILLTMPTEETLKIQKQDADCGNGPWQFNSYAEFKR